MDENQNEEILSTNAEEVEAENAGEEEFTYDDDGNIVVEDSDLEEDAAESVTTDENAETEESEDSATEETNLDETENDSEENELPEMSNETQNKQESELYEGEDDEYAKLKAEYVSFKARAKDMLEKLGEKDLSDENLTDAMIKVAAEAADMTPEEYRAALDEQAKAEAAEQARIEAEFERVSSADLVTLKAHFPELKDAKSIKDIPKWEEFGRLRDMGFSVTTAYRAVNGDSVQATTSQIRKSGALDGTKGHLRTATSRAASSGGVMMPKETLGQWRQMFPYKSDKEIEKLYKDTLK